MAQMMVLQMSAVAAPAAAAAARPHQMPWQPAFLQQPAQTKANKNQKFFQTKLRIWKHV